MPVQAREFLQIRESDTALPTASRQFLRTDRLLLRFRAYGPGGTAPEIAVRLRNSQGETMSSLPTPTSARIASSRYRFYQARLRQGFTSSR